MNFPRYWFDAQRASFLGTVDWWITQPVAAQAQRWGQHPAGCQWQPTWHDFFTLFPNLKLHSSTQTDAFLLEWRELHLYLTSWFLIVLTVPVIRMKHSLWILKCSYVLWMHFTGKHFVWQVSAAGWMASSPFEDKRKQEDKCNAFSSQNMPCTEASLYSGAFITVGHDTKSQKRYRLLLTMAWCLSCTDRELLAEQHLEQSIIEFFSALVWVMCLLMISLAGLSQGQSVCHKTQNGSEAQGTCYLIERAGRGLGALRGWITDNR